MGAASRGQAKQGKAKQRRGESSYRCGGCAVFLGRRLRSDQSVWVSVLVLSSVSLLPSRMPGGGWWVCDVRWLGG